MYSQQRIVCQTKKGQESRPGKLADSTLTALADAFERQIAQSILVYIAARQANAGCLRFEPPSVIEAPLKLPRCFEAKRGQA